MNETCKIGEKWRKHGPADWVKIVSVQLPGHPEYDGGLSGISFVLKAEMKQHHRFKARN